MLAPPHKTIRASPSASIVPYPPGGQSDIFTRLIADAMRQQLNTPVNVENRAGAGTTLGANVVAKSPPDGYTLLLGAASATAITPLTIKNAQFDAKQITPDHLGGQGALHPGRGQALPAQHGGGVHRVCQGESRQGELGHARHGRGAASDGRDVRARRPASR
jgi:hypothetical protein